jgi:hypothetical protein
LMPGWASPCMTAKTVHWKAAGTMGRAAPLETHRSPPPQQC